MKRSRDVSASTVVQFGCQAIKQILLCILSCNEGNAGVLAFTPAFCVRQAVRFLTVFLYKNSVIPMIIAGILDVRVFGRWGGSLSS